MPTLPTITVTDAQWRRLVPVFNDGPTYKAWLREQIIAKVIAHESELIRQQANLEAEANRKSAVQDLSGIA